MTQSTSVKNKTCLTNKYNMLDGFKLHQRIKDITKKGKEQNKFIGQNYRSLSEFKVTKKRKLRKLQS